MGNSCNNDNTEEYQVDFNNFQSDTKNFSRLYRGNPKDERNDPFLRKKDKERKGKQAITSHKTRVDFSWWSRA